MSDANWKKEFRPMNVVAPKMAARTSPAQFVAELQGSCLEVSAPTHNGMR
jgi:hypothetical protein